MNYNNILKQLSIQEKVSVEEIEKEMQTAINLSGLNCTAKELIERTTALLEERLYIV